MDFSDLKTVLGDLEYAFLKARYSYEVNAKLSDQKISEKGQDWVDAGAPLDEAGFRFHPHELSALVFALCLHIQEKLGLPEEDVLVD